ncbi:hypothetical protein ALEK_1879 [Poseidonibacter lekithochrous]|nr:hypothetical protein ALEK_1879 [Poseidonibacter lekithochrous]
MRKLYFIGIFYQKNIQFRLILSSKERIKLLNNFLISVFNKHLDIIAIIKQKRYKFAKYKRYFYRE